MTRMTLAAAAVATLFTAPVLAQSTTTMTCKDEMAKAEPMMNSMTDATKKASAMKEMIMAKDMMAKNDEKNCIMHMQNALAMMK